MITGGANQGARGFVFSTSKQTVWVQLAEGVDKDKVVMKRKMTWIKKLNEVEDESASSIFLHHQTSLRVGHDGSILVAMPKGHALDRDDVKAAVAESTNGAVADNALILPQSRNCLLHFDATEDVKALLEKKVVVIHGRACRVGLHHGAKHQHPSSSAPLTATVTNRPPPPPRREEEEKEDGDDGRKINSRAAAFRAATAAGNKKRRVA